MFSSFSDRLTEINDLLIHPNLPPVSLLALAKVKIFVQNQSSKEDFISALTEEAYYLVCWRQLVTEMKEKAKLINLVVKLEKERIAQLQSVQVLSKPDSFKSCKRIMKIINIQETLGKQVIKVLSDLNVTDELMSEESLKILNGVFKKEISSLRQELILLFLLNKRVNLKLFFERVNGVENSRKLQLLALLHPKAQTFVKIISSHQVPQDIINLSLIHLVDLAAWHFGKNRFKVTNLLYFSRCINFKSLTLTSFKALELFIGNVRKASRVLKFDDLQELVELVCLASANSTNESLKIDLVTLLDQILKQNVLKGLNVVTLSVHLLHRTQVTDVFESFQFNNEKQEALFDKAELKHVMTLLSQFRVLNEKLSIKSVRLGLKLVVDQSNIPLEKSCMTLTMLKNSFSNLNANHKSEIIQGAKDLTRHENRRNDIMFLLTSEQEKHPKSSLQTSKHAKINKNSLQEIKISPTVEAKINSIVQNNKIRFLVKDMFEMYRGSTHCSTKMLKRTMKQLSFKDWMKFCLSGRLVPKRMSKTGAAWVFHQVKKYSHKATSQKHLHHINLKEFEIALSVLHTKLQTKKTDVKEFHFFLEKLHHACNPLQLIPTEKRSKSSSIQFKPAKKQDKVKLTITIPDANDQNVEYDRNFVRLVQRELKELRL